jgi:hypothetical protein
MSRSSSDASLAASARSLSTTTVSTALSSNAFGLAVRTAWVNATV